METMYVYGYGNNQRIKRSSTRHIRRIAGRMQRSALYALVLIVAGLWCLILLRGILA
jgi:hypothetical protein